MNCLGWSKTNLVAPAALALVVVLWGGPAQASDVGVSIQISQPGVYGRVDIGRFGQPVVIVREPVLVVRPVVVAPAPAPPLYLWVPPGHRKHWQKHCEKYDACGQPVYFVQERWYQDNVMSDRHGKGKHDEKGRGKGRGHGHDD